MRLDLWEAAEESAASSVIVAGDPEASELINRIISGDTSEQMPPVESGKSLPDEQKALLKKWVEEGAIYEKHWAFEAPTRPQLPSVRNEAWVTNPIDFFVLARLESEGIQPSPQAKPHTLLRRLSLDLIGLPPTIEEIEYFQKLPEQSAYKRTIKQLLASPHFGEKHAREWLDAARYADSDGYEKDLPREVWMYRDWVINAFNNDMPYDQFIVEQIAGDLLPESTQSERIATGFMRNSMTNREGGIDPEQFRMEAMFDRMDAIGKSVLGLTVQCAQCHTHKYDPLTHTDYYRMFALLNNCDEAEISVYTATQQKQRQHLYREIEEIESDLKRETPNWQELMSEWESSLVDQESGWQIVRPEVDTSGGQKHYLLEDGSILAQGYAPPTLTSNFKAEVEATSITAVRLELLNDPNLPRGGPGRSSLGLCVLSEIKAVAAPLSNPQKKTELKFIHATSDVNPKKEKQERTSDYESKPDRFTGPVGYAIDSDDTTAWGIDIGPGRSNVPREAVFALDKPFDSEEAFIITFSLVQSHGGRRIDSPNTNNLGRFRISINSNSTPTANPIPKSVREILSIPADQRTPDQLDQVFRYWRTTVPAWKDANQRIETLWKKHPPGNSQLVLHEREQPRTTCRLDRGSFLNPAEEVQPGVPGFLHSLEVESPNRLDFARWLTDRRSPTTARAIVNRIWQSYFGTGLVETSDDFGLQGTPPTHPELLDWLAVELMDNNWSQKHIHRLIVNSSTYRQQSKITPILLERDPENRLLTRGPRQRLNAEIVRDVSLTASGLLDLSLGGPSIYPPAPEFLFVPPASYEPKSWPYAAGTDQYRRSLYIFRFRSVPHPVLETFDAPSGNVSCVRRSRSNTPLQALTTLNEPLFFDCARALAEKTLDLQDLSDRERLTYAFRRCLTRSPREEELSVLLDFLNLQQSDLSQSRTGENQLVVTHEEQPKTPRSSEIQAKQAAWTAVSRVLLNLDETVTKE
ncbi:Planctomycete cytochrome C [Bythopirellula polymerisocia]|uniref:Planctomycete cytochrome C n=1 Tax=Bythopirellula polymerisocia TaxID=2528003 RepID=A0A5C6CT11_9BACT|nr:Planctomycete cytochrome C [Bythopirellula polymerisocia]